ncbi:MAG: hypothetical protein PHT80_00100 [Lentisphaeria bacterium]|nr:hypothetical protein [Lentisphaeria bacterium]
MYGQDGLQNRTPAIGKGVAVIILLAIPGSQRGVITSLSEKEHADPGKNDQFAGRDIAAQPA